MYETVPRATMVAREWKPPLLRNRSLQLFEPKGEQHGVLKWNCSLLIKSELQLYSQRLASCQVGNHVVVSDGSKMLIPMNILDTCLHKVVTSHLLLRVSSENIYRLKSTTCSSVMVCYIFPEVRYTPQGPYLQS